MTPTPETHTYEGMFRPPWETVVQDVRDGKLVKCECCGWRLYHSKQIYPCWHAGHFDIPVYRPREAPAP